MVAAVPPVAVETTDGTAASDRVPLAMPGLLKDLLGRFIYKNKIQHTHKKCFLFFTSLLLFSFFLSLFSVFVCAHFE